MRVTTNMQNQMLCSSVNKNEAIMMKLQTELSSGNKINSAAEDPGAVPSIMNANSMLNKIDIYEDNITYLNGEIEVSDGILGQVNDRVQRIRDLTIQAANGTNSTDQLKDINDEIKQIKEHLVSLANTQYQNSYIYSGSKTNTPAYEITDDGSIVYNGSSTADDSYKRIYSISDGVSVSINLAGIDIFGYSNAIEGTDPVEYEGEGLFQSLNELTQILDSDTPDYEGIRGQIDVLDEAITTVNSSRTQIGGVQTRLNMTYEQHETSKVTYSSLKSELQEVDIAEVVSDLSAQEVALQASLYANSQALNTSLLDYL